jgi:hypothetical protein
MKKWIIATVVLALLSVCMVRYAFLHEISIEPYNMVIHQKKKELGIPAVYLISYADGPEVFFRNQNTLASSALNKGIDFIYNYRKEHLAPEFIKKNKYILDQKRGAGYWLWKPHLILETLNKMPEAAILIYSDTGYVFRNDVEKLLDIISHQDKDIILTHLDAPSVKEITKRETFIRMKCDNEAAFSSPHIMASFMVLKNTKYVRQFIITWLKHCEDKDKIIDGPSSKPEYPEYIHHQHDESILSLVFHLESNKKNIYLYDYNQLRKEVAFRHHRHPGWKKREYRVLKEYKFNNPIDWLIEEIVIKLLGGLNAVSDFVKGRY